MHSPTEDFKSRWWVFVEIRQGRSWPRENHIDANSIGQGLAIDTRSPAVYIRYICAAPPKISKVGGRYL
jgi:hypothetical protein